MNITTTNYTYYCFLVIVYSCLNIVRHVPGIRTIKQFKNQND